MDQLVECALQPPPKWGLVTTLSDPVARWVVVAHPNFMRRLARNGAANFAGIAPDELRVMTAYAVAGVGSVGIVGPFRCPDADGLGGRAATADDFKEIFA